MGHRVCTLSRTSVLSRRNVWWPSTNPVPLTGTVRGMTTRTAPDVRRQQLLRVAERIFATRPYASVSVQEIADEAGVTRGLIHHYFGNKNGVMAAVIREIAPDRAPAVLPAEGSVRERVEIRVDLLMSVFESHSEAWAEGLSAGIEPEIIAEAALSTAFGELFRSSGEAAALALLDRMREKVIAGEFEPLLRRH